MQIQRIGIYNYRRLRQVSLSLDPETTVFVGANNSGKTAAAAAMAWFLREQRAPLTLSDIHVAGWGELDKHGLTWLGLPGLVRETDQALWDDELRTLQDVLPALDVQIEVSGGDIHLVRDIIPNLEWTTETPLRVRLQVELAKDVDELTALAKRYVDAHRATHGDQSENLNAWPRSFTDFLARDLADHPPRVASWIVSAETVRHEESAPPPPTKTRRLETSPLFQLIRVDFIPAQRGLGGEEHSAGAASGDTRMRTGELTRRIVKHVGGPLEKAIRDQSFTNSLFKAYADAEQILDKSLNEALTEPLKSLSKLGYPSLQHPEKLEVRSRVRPEQLLNHNASVIYRTSSASLPEHTIGLGYQNLLVLSFEFLRFRAERRLDNPVQQAVIPRIHLVIVEEPEAHLHVQVQRLFITKARSLLIGSDDNKKGLTTQLVVSSHASNIAHALPFSRLRYFRRTDALPTDAPGVPGTDVVDLTDTFGSQPETARFVERYLQVQHSDLFFADAAILVEGAAERILLPLFIEAHSRFASDEPLSSRHLTVLPIGGAHAHRLKPLIERIGLPTLIITDLDPVDPTKPAASEDKGKRKKKKEKVPVRPNGSQRTSNPTLTKWLAPDKSIDDLLVLGTDEHEVVLGKWPQAKVRVAYQQPESDTRFCAATFEDALVLANFDWFKSGGFLPKLPTRSEPEGCALSDEHPERDENSLDDMRDLLSKTPEAKLPGALLSLISSKSFDKANFALDLFMTIVEAPEDGGFRCPRYIREGLDWLQSTLAGKALAPKVPASTGPGDKPGSAHQGKAAA